MPVALLDTNAVSDLMRDDPKVRARMSSHADPVVTSVIVVGEIRHGVNRLPSGKKRRELESRAQGTLARSPLNRSPSQSPMPMAVSRRLWKARD